MMLALLLLSLPAQPLPATGGATVALADVVTAQPWTVVLFFSPQCPVQRAHDAQVVELARTFAPRGVTFIAVDAQSTATLEVSERAVKDRGYPFRIVVDPTSTWADALGARFSTTVVLLDARGRIHYRGGIDSERVEHTASPARWLHDALERVLSGQAPEHPETKAMGCVLRRP